MILATPLIQATRNCFPDANIDFLTTPICANLIETHPVLNKVIIFDKHQRDRGINRLRHFARCLQKKNYDLALIPHRSFRSSLLAWLAKIPQRIGFNTSAGAWLFTRKVPYRNDLHEIDRNLTLLRPFSSQEFKISPQIVPDSTDKQFIDDFLATATLPENSRFLAMAPGSVWETKRWPAENFVELGRRLPKQWNCTIFLVGGNDENALCQTIADQIAEPSRVFNVAGNFTFRQSAELLSRCNALITNDSAPLHLGVAVDVPVLAIFGPTAPTFGFYPRGEKHAVIEKDIYCRPCAIHGGRKCPTGTFLCMKSITPDDVLSRIKQKLTRA